MGSGTAPAGDRRTQATVGLFADAKARHEPTTTRDRSYCRGDETLSTTVRAISMNRAATLEIGPLL